MTIALRVVARYARRAIPFDVSKVRREFAELAEEALDTALSMTPDGRDIGKNTWAKKALKLRHVKGHDRVLLVVIESRPGSSSKPTAGGAFEVGRNTIRLYLNSTWTPEAFREFKWATIQRMEEMGIHEVTHALDVLDEDAEYERASGNPKVYYNQPAEVRAYARMVVEEAKLSFRKLRMRSRRTKRPLPTGHKLIEKLLTDSKTWREIEPYLNRKNEKLIRQIVVRELQDADLL